MSNTPEAAIPPAGDIYSPTPNEDLRRRISLGGLAAKDAAPVELRFSRSRELPIDWGSLVVGLPDQADLGSHVLWQMFHDAAGIGSWDVQPIVDNDAAVVVATALREMFSANDGSRAFPILDSISDERSAEQIKNGEAPMIKSTYVRSAEIPNIIVAHLTSGREYGLRKNASVNLAASDFLPDPAQPDIIDQAFCARYRASWKVISATLQVFQDRPGLVFGERSLPEFSEVDLSAPVLQRKTSELKARLEFADKVKDIPISLPSDADAAEARSVLDRYLALQSIVWESEETWARLLDEAGDLGYRIYRDPKKIPLPDGSEHTVPAYRLTKPVERVVTWTTTQTRLIIEIIHVGNHRRIAIVPVTATQFHAKQLKLDVPAKIDYDPWVEVERSLVNQSYAVFRMELGDDGYVTANGDRLTEVIERCELDETFRVNCALLVPVYEQLLTDGFVKTKYILIKHPLGNQVPNRFPRVIVEEDYVYQTTHLGHDLGELVSSINLAPGEQRKLTLSRSFTMEHDSKRANTSAVDVTSASSNDLTAEFEHAFRNEAESGTASNVNAKAGFGIGPFSFGGGASRATSNSSKTLSSDMQKVVRKAAMSFQSKSRLEVSTSDSTSTKSMNSETTSMELRNINEGRTLNILLFQLLSHYRSDLVLEGIRLTVIPGTELISGTGIREPLTVPVQQIAKLREVLLHLPVNAVNENSFLAGLTDLFQDAVLDSVAEDGTQLINVRYADPANPNIFAIQELSINAHPLNSTRFSVPSNALHMDAFLGVMEAAEPYYERLRAQEVRSKAAAVYKEAAAGQLDFAKAHALSKGEIDLPWDLRSPADNSITAMAFAGNTHLTIGLRHPLPPGTWQLVHLNHVVAVANPSHVGQIGIGFIFPSYPTWVQNDQRWKFNTVLREQNSLAAIGYSGM